MQANETLRFFPHSGLEKIKISNTVSNKSWIKEVNQKYFRDDVLECKSGFAQKESGGHSRLQSKGYHSPMVHIVHREALEGKADALVARV